MSSAHETVLEIDLSALKHNYTYITSHLQPNTKVMAVVKAFGYGSDAAEIAKELVPLGVNYFAVAYVKEGIALRDAGIQTPILVLHPQINNFEQLIDRCLEPALYSTRVLKTFIATAEQKDQKNYPVHLKFNTGLNRLGFRKDEVNLVIEDVSGSSSIHVKSIFSHLAASEDLMERDFTLQQINSFKKIAEEVIEQLGYTPLLHQSNTSAILNYPEANFDMVRTGIGLYGYGNSKKEDKNLTPFATLKTIISQIHIIAPNETVGYNRAYKATGFEKIATLPIGHADGISRKYGNGKGTVLIQGKKAPIVGNVCMDMLMVNITNIDCKEGDEVIIIDERQNASNLSETINSISYELLTAISQRVKRVVVRK